MASEAVGANARRLVVQRGGRETDGALLEVRASYDPHSELPPLHYHPYQEEQFEVLSGRFRVIVEGRERVYLSGERFAIPANTVHGMHNIGDEQGQLLWQVRPALRTEALLTTLWGLAEDGQSSASGVPNLLQVAVIMQSYSDEMRLAKPPYFVQRVLFGLLAPLGKLRGYRASYGTNASS